MKLEGFQVTNFRSVEDSNWIEADDVTALIGTNESGKTNILLALWKLNPAKEGEIIPTTDYPRKLYNEFRNLDEKPTFIRATFTLDDQLSREISKMANIEPEQINLVEVSRDFDGNYEVDFPNASLAETIARARILSTLEEAMHSLDAISPFKSEEELKKLILTSVSNSVDSLPNHEELDSADIERILSSIDMVKTESAAKTGTLIPRFQQLRQSLIKFQSELKREHPRDNDEVTDKILDSLPKFVYYSTYGNLDSEIYLPHVIANMGRDDLGLKEQAKTRTLKVLFEFVQLSPQEILELGNDFDERGREPTDEEIAQIAEKKKQRSILLQSASSSLTARFRDWWKQGAYRFRFEADGGHFRIWVSDDKRPEEIELEGRSTGLQWFLSFYLVFLVERADAHAGAILLLDEPGLSLHPLAQRDLSQFFDGLATVNQLMFTCHSPFLVDADRLDRARKVYVDNDGTSKVTPDLRFGEGTGDQQGASYAVYAALGLSVAESLMLGCTPVVVEGASDQHYLTSIKNLLIASGRSKPGRELIFPPAGGAKGVKPVASLLGGRNEELPVALFDSDRVGSEMAESLKRGLYAGEANLVLQVAPFAGLAESEIEDLIPSAVVIRQLDRWQRSSEIPFGDEYETGKPIVPQIEAWAKKHGVVLQVPGWKVELSKRVKHQLLTDGPESITPEILDRWTQLFDAFEQARTPIT